MIDAPDGFEPIYRPWRNGRKVGRTLYAMVGDLPCDDDVLIGVVDTRELAWEVVIAHNEAGSWSVPGTTPDDVRAATVSDVVAYLGDLMYVLDDKDASTVRAAQTMVVEHFTAEPRRDEAS